MMEQLTKKDRELLSDMEESTCLETRTEQHDNLIELGLIDCADGWCWINEKGREVCNSKGFVSTRLAELADEIIDQSS